MNAKRAGTLFALTLTAGTLGVAGPASAVECGTPAVDAVYETVSHPALTHVESRWTRTVIDTPAQPAWVEPAVIVPDSYRTETRVLKEAWDEEVVIREAYEEKVIDQAAQDAVYRTVFLWRHKVTREERWEPEDWNGKSYSESWQIIPGQRREELVSEALPEISHIVHHDAVVEIVHHPAVTEDVQVLVPGYTIPAVHHPAVAEKSHVEEQWAAQSPGYGWTDTGDTRVVVDEEAWQEDVLVTPAQPAGPECPTDDDSGTPDDDDGDTGGETDGGAVEVAHPATSSRGQADGPERTTTRSTAQASAAPARLAHTGSDSTQYAVLGVFLLAGGVALTVRARLIGA